MAAWDSEEQEVGSRRHVRWAAWLLGGVLGSALQLQQPSLWSGQSYMVLMAAALFVYVFTAIYFVANKARSLAIVVLAASAAFALCGVRAVAFAQHGLASALEGQDLLLTGEITAMPQRNAAGTRFRFAVETAHRADAGAQSGQSGQSGWGGQEGRPVEVSLPPLLYLGWYGEPGGEAPPVLRAGQRWQWVVRLKAPHGNSNPHGFDYELWLWEQGLQATGYVRLGRSQAAPRLLAQTAGHPLEQVRQAVRDAILAAVPDARSAGIIAALVVGDQAAIERWRITNKS